MQEMVMGLLLAQACMPPLGIPDAAGLGINSTQRFMSLGQQRLEQEICRFQNPVILLEIDPNLLPPTEVGSSPSTDSGQ
ncbi:MAG: hypothetical protein NZ821_02630 [Gloeomargarita sp. SKYB31]|nr:hypothetical protein [Gloeomargarita sp. SKYB31]